jgi:hypothetical protein
MYIRKCNTPRVIFWARIILDLLLLYIYMYITYSLLTLTIKWTNSSSLYALDNLPYMSERTARVKRTLESVGIIECVCVCVCVCFIYTHFSIPLRYCCVLCYLHSAIVRIRNTCALYVPKEEVRIELFQSFYMYPYV